MESTIGGVLFDVWFKEGGQQKTMARNLKLHFYQSFKFTSPGMESRSSKRSTYIGADIGTYSRNVRFVPKADIAHRSELCALRHARPMPPSPRKRVFSRT